MCATWSARQPLSSSGEPRSVGDGPGGPIDPETAAHHAGRAGVLGFERKEPDRRLRFGLHFRLAFGVAAPRADDESTGIVDRRAKILEAGRRRRVRIAE